MKTSQFTLLATMTAFATWFFNEAIMSASYFLAGFWFWLIYRNMRIAYLLSKVADYLDKYNNKK